MNIGEVVFLKIRLSIFSFTHAMVDATCAAIIFSFSNSKSMELDDLAFLLVLYNVVAFALQSPIGLITDKIKKPYEIATIGCILTALSIFAMRWPILVVCLAGLGNALFHVGGGVVCLNMKPGKASIPGIFVAPGALGLLMGTLIGKSEYFMIWPFSMLLVVNAMILLYLKDAQFDDQNIKSRDGTRSGVSLNHFEAIIILMMTAIAIRSLTGMVLNYPWKSNSTLLISFTLAVVLGKGLGGILADRLGWMRTTLFGLLLSAPLIILGFNHPILAISGVFLFNLTMPVTLTVLANMLPGQPGFAFGLSTLAIIAGAFPAFTGIKFLLYNKGIILAAILISSVLLYIGLRLYYKTNNKSSIIHNMPMSNQA